MTRASLRARLRAGVSADAIVQAYLAEYGAAALAVPPDAGHNKAVYALPIGVALAGGAAAVALVRRWRARALAPSTATGGGGREGAARRAAVTSRDRGAKDAAQVVETPEQKTAYDKRLDEELRDLDD
jgi:hypothetical protein